MHSSTGKRVICDDGCHMGPFKKPHTVTLDTQPFAVTLPDKDLASGTSGVVSVSGWFTPL